LWVVANKKSAFRSILKAGNPGKDVRHFGQRIAGRSGAIVGRCDTGLSYRTRTTKVEGRDSVSAKGVYR